MDKIDGIPFDQLTRELQERLAPRYERLGYLGEFFQVAAHAPESLTTFIDFSDAVKSAVPEGIAEVVALTAAKLTGATYETNQHEQLCLKLGYSHEWIRRVQALDADGVDHHAGIAQQYVVAAIARDCAQTGRSFEAVRAAFGDITAIAVMFITARYLAHAVMVNTLELEPPVPSIFGSSP